MSIDILKNIKETIASLGGKNIRPLEPGHFQGVVAVPKKYFEGRTDLEALLGFLEDDNWEDNFR